MKGGVRVAGIAPEVETVRISLEKRVVGKKIVKTEVFEEKISEKALIKLLRKQNKEDFITNTVDCQFKEINRRAKFLIAKVEKDNTDYYVLVHLAMAGKWLYAEKLENLSDLNRKHILVQFTLDDGSFLVYSDYRRFGAISIHTEEEYLNMKSIHGLGPEPFWDGADQTFLTNVRSKKKYFDKPIKGVIMDQGVVAGVGNIYACESLKVLGINPYTATKDLTDDELIDLFHVAREMMLFSISVGGSSVNDYVDGDGMAGSFQDYLKVYGQLTCECGEEILREEIASRTTHYCPTCQPAR